MRESDKENGRVDNGADVVWNVKQKAKELKENRAEEKRMGGNIRKLVHY